MDGSKPETCTKCGFDSRRWTLRDAGGVFGALGWWWQHATAGIGAKDLNRRPGPAVWSALEYGLHTALAVAIIRTEVEMILAENGARLDNDFDIGDATDANWAVIDRDATLADLEREGAAMASLAQRRDAPWGNVGYFKEMTLQAEAYLIHDAHDATHHFMDAARELSEFTGRAEGRLERINVSDGGVPKLPVGRASVTIDGVEGDRQRDRKHHGRPFQAVCLWSAEVIDGLAAEGHPIAAGRAGENFTVRGLDWGSLRPGSRLRVGDALVELSFPAIPCHNQTRWFSDGDFSRISHEVNPQGARWYGWVRESGSVAEGDAVVVGV